MTNPWLHRLAILLAVCALLVIVGGAMLNPGTQTAHRIAAATLGALTLGLVLWLIFTDPRAEARRLGWLTLAIVAFEGLAGLSSVQSTIPHIAGIAHALLAPALFAALVAIALTTSPAWSRGPELVFDYGWPSMRSMAILTPILVLLQISLGAAFRQQTLTLLPHVLSAMFVALMILFESICVLQQFPAHRALPLVAKTLLGVAFGQVFLGIAALIMKSMADDTNLAVMITVASHVTGGAVTLATTVVLSILIRRNVQPRIEDDDEDEEDDPEATVTT